MSENPIIISSELPESVIPLIGNAPWKYDACRLLAEHSQREFIWIFGYIGVQGASDEGHELADIRNIFGMTPQIFAVDSQEPLRSKKLAKELDVQLIHENIIGMSQNYFFTDEELPFPDTLIYFGVDAYWSRDASDLNEALLAGCANWIRIANGYGFQLLFTFNGMKPIDYIRGLISQVYLSDEMFRVYELEDDRFALIVDKQSSSLESNHLE